MNRTTAAHSGTKPLPKVGLKPNSAAIKLDASMSTQHQHHHHHKERHRLAHHLSTRGGTGEQGWVDGITALAEDAPANALLQEREPVVRGGSAPCLQIP